MVKEISHQFKEKSEGHIKDKKLFLYSGHDLSIINVLRALDINDFIHPDFGASIIFELHQLQKKYYVKVSTIIITDLSFHTMFNLKKLCL